MAKYVVTLNGKNYEVEVEKNTAKITNTTAAAAPAAPAPKAATGAGAAINAPMPGTILDVKVSVGDQVKKGQVLMILEAMKMENEIMAPADGTVTSVGVTKGTAVESGTALCTIQ